MISRILMAAVYVLLCVGSADAQQQDAAFLTRALGAMSLQRNQALDTAVAQQARADGLQEDLAKAQARIKELEPKKGEPSEK